MRRGAGPNIIPTPLALREPFRCCENTTTGTKSQPMSDTMVDSQFSWNLPGLSEFLHRA